jgi:hypothetical protein
MDGAIDQNTNWILFWTAVAAIATLATVAVAIFIHINERMKDRRQRHVESMVKFSGDFYSDKQMSQLFLKVQSNRLRPHVVEKQGSPDELALAHLLEYLNAVGIALERKLVSVKAIAATSIAYIVLTTSRNRTVAGYLDRTKGQHARCHIPSPGWPQFEHLAQRLAIYARKHSGTPDLRPWYSRIFSPNRGWHWSQVRKIEDTPYDWRSRDP